MKTFRNLETPLVKGCHCLDYGGGSFADGYGAVWQKFLDQSEGKAPAKRRGRVLKAHRVAFTEAYGPIPEDKLVLHHCDRRICVELRHLYLGTQKDNMRDCVERGRFTARRHSDKTVVAIRAASGRNIDIARKFKVSASYVSALRHNKQRTPT